MIYVTRPHYVDAIRWTGDNTPAIAIAAATLPPHQRPPNGQTLVMPNNPSLNAHGNDIAVWHAARGTYQNLGAGDMLLRDEDGLSVMDPDTFHARYCTPHEATLAGFKRPDALR